jgi:hypothetical protein
MFQPPGPGRGGGSIGFMAGNDGMLVTRGKKKFCSGDQIGRECQENHR